MKENFAVRALCSLLCPPFCSHIHGAVAEPTSAELGVQPRTLPPTYFCVPLFATTFLQEAKGFAAGLHGQTVLFAVVLHGSCSGPVAQCGGRVSCRMNFLRESLAEST